MYMRSDRHGNRTTFSEQAQTTADYLAEVHWEYDDIDRLEANVPNTGQLPQPEPQANHDEAKRPRYRSGTIETEEITTAMQNMKKRKSPGPDNCDADAYIVLPEDTSSTAKHTEFMVETQGTTAIADTRQGNQPLQKKGDPADPANYRPISLLNSQYKLYVIVLSERMNNVLPYILGPSQYGFRAGHSTADPIYILRRIIAYLERGDGDGILVFLDWEKVFDKLYQSRLGETMARFGVPNELINATRSLYDHPTFEVTIQGHTSTHQRQERGIRQGCPLSPLLFIITLSGIMHDTIGLLQERHGNGEDWLFHISHLLYADDTTLLSRTMPVMQKLLNTLETVAARFGLKLNHNKSVWVASGIHRALTFRDETPVAYVAETVYLGCTINIFPAKEQR